MNKIKPVHFVVSDNRIVVVDDQGQIWERAVTGKKWYYRGELPDEDVEPTMTHVNLDLSDTLS